MNVRRFNEKDTKKVVNLIHKTLRTVNIKDYTKNDMEKLCRKITGKMIDERAKHFHCYVITDKDKIVGVRSIGQYWNVPNETSFFNVFADSNCIGKGIGKLIISTLESDEIYKNSIRVEIPASITAVEFYKHMGFGFKKGKDINGNDVFGNITDSEGEYRMEKYPKKEYDNSSKIQYNMRPYINNEYHDYYNFIYGFKKLYYAEKGLFKNFINNNINNLMIIRLNDEDIGFYNGKDFDSSTYEIEDIYLLPEYQRKGIGTQVINDIIEKNKYKSVKVNCPKTNDVEMFFEKLGFTYYGDTKDYFKMIRKSTISEEEFNHLVDKLIEKDKKDELIQLISTCPDYHFDNVFDYFLDGKDSQKDINYLINFLNMNYDLLRRYHIKSSVVVDKLIKTKSKEYIKEFLKSDELYFLNDEEKAKLREYIKH